MAPRASVAAKSAAPKAPAKPAIDETGEFPKTLFGTRGVTVVAKDADHQATLGDAYKEDPADVKDEDEADPAAKSAKPAKGKPEPPATV